MYEVKVNQGGVEVFGQNFEADSVHAALALAALAAKPVPPSLYGYHVHIDPSIKAENEQFLDLGAKIPWMVTCIWRSIGQPFMAVENYPQVEFIKRAHAAGKNVIVRFADPMHYIQFYGNLAYRQARGAVKNAYMGPFTAWALGSFNAWAADVLRVLHPYIHAVQLWNEVAELGSGGNYLISWDGNRIEPFYMETVQGYSYRKLKGLYPELKIFMPAIGNPHSNSRADKFLRGCFDRGIANWTDGIPVHAYNSMSAKYYGGLFELWNWPDVYFLEVNKSGGANWPYILGVKNDMVAVAGDKVKAIVAYSWKEPANSSEPQLTSMQFKENMING